MTVSPAPSSANPPASSTAAGPGAPSLVRRAGTAIPLALLAGAVLGALAWLSDDLGYPTGLLIPANLVGAWALVAFAAGAGARTILGGAGRGVFALLAAVGVYYLVYGVFGEGWRAAGAVRAATIWGSVAVVAGPPLGLAGSLWRHREGTLRSLGLAVPVGVLVAEGVVLQLGLGDDLPARALLVVEVLVGLALPLLLLRGTRARAIAYAGGAVVSLIAVGGLLVVIPALRAAADTF